MTTTNSNHSMSRDYWRCWSFMDIHDELDGEIYEHALKKIVSSKEALAVRAHAMQSAFRIALPFPELQMELLSILVKLENEDAPAICARSRILSKKLKNSLRN